MTYNVAMHGAPGYYPVNVVPQVAPFRSEIEQMPQEAKPVRAFTQINRDEAEKKLLKVCEDLGIASHTRKKMAPLAQYEVVLLLDNSRSMSFRDGELRGNIKKSRWEELHEMLAPLIDILGSLDEDGVTIHFFDRKFEHVSKREQVADYFRGRPENSTTPLCASLQKIIADYNADQAESKRDLFLLIATDGEPTGQDETAARFTKMLRNESALPSERLPEGTRVSILTCTSNDSEVGYLKKVDDDKDYLDVTDDYQTELAKVRQKSSRLARQFTKPVWISKMILGAMYSDFDNLNELASIANEKGVDEKFVFGTCFGLCG